jgi:hypothetical protein
MKPHARRNTAAFPYFKLATFDPRYMCFRDGRRCFDTVESAEASARTPGRYRVSAVTEDGRFDLHEFVTLLACGELHRSDVEAAC